MITEWLLSLATGFAAWIGDLFPAWTPPEQLTNASSTVGGLISTFSGIGAWVSFPVIGACVTVAIATWVIVVGTKLVRAVAAHIPLFGGAGD